MLLFRGPVSNTSYLRIVTARFKPTALPAVISKAFCCYSCYIACLLLSACTVACIACGVVES